MRIEIRNDSVMLDGYVNAVGRDSRPFMLNGKKIVEQIRPKVFERALEKAENVDLLLNHDETRVLGSTSQGNIELYEDNIGLRAICEVTDSDVIEKAKRKELRGWSFGFTEPDESFEDAGNGLERRFIDGLKLKEVSIIDNTKIPVYVGTSIEQRADEEVKEETRGEEFRALTIDNTTINGEPDYTKFNERINQLKTGN